MIDPYCRGLLAIHDASEDRPAVYQDDGAPHWTRAELRCRALQWAECVARPEAGVVFVMCRNEAGAVAALLGTQAAGHAVALIEANLDVVSLHRLVSAYSPDWIIGPPDCLAGMALSPRQRVSHDGWAGLELSPSQSWPVTRGLSLLLSTSGTTGSPRFVRLAASAVQANAYQIIDALGIGDRDTGVCHLPLSYAYGLSVLTSHLVAGAAIHLTRASISDRAFWEGLVRAEATQLPGVPFHYEFLARADLGRLGPQSLRTYTQAGGALHTALQIRIHEKIEALGGRFFVMYGQTEAAPRMTTLPHAQLRAKLGSVGPALPHGRLTVVDADGRALPTGKVGRILYEGPNVMLGYALNRDDLRLLDAIGGKIDTGDTGWLDHDGYLYVKGRADRVAKLSGFRISLDEVERRFDAVAPVAAVACDQMIKLFTEDPASVSELVPKVAAEYQIETRTFRVFGVDRLPRTSRGKLDYAALELVA